MAHRPSRGQGEDSLTTPGCPGNTIYKLAKFRGRPSATKIYIKIMEDKEGEVRSPSYLVRDQ